MRWAEMPSCGLRAMCPCRMARQPPRASSTNRRRSPAVPAHGRRQSSRVSMPVAFSFFPDCGASSQNSPRSGCVTFSSTHDPMASPGLRALAAVRYVGCRASSPAAGDDATVGQGRASFGMNGGRERGRGGSGGRGSGGGRGGGGGRGDGMSGIGTEFAGRFELLKVCRGIRSTIVHHEHPPNSVERESCPSSDSLGH